MSCRFFTEPHCIQHGHHAVSCCSKEEMMVWILWALLSNARTTPMNYSLSRSKFHYTTVTALSPRNKRSEFIVLILLVLVLCSRFFFEARTPRTHRIPCTPLKKCKKLESGFRIEGTRPCLPRDIRSALVWPSCCEVILRKRVDDNAWTQVDNGKLPSCQRICMTGMTKSLLSRQFSNRGQASRYFRKWEKSKYQEIHWEIGFRFWAKTNVFRTSVLFWLIQMAFAFGNFWGSWYPLAREILEPCALDLSFESKLWAVV